MKQELSVAEVPMPPQPSYSKPKPVMPKRLATFRSRPRVLLAAAAVTIAVIATGVVLLLTRSADLPCNPPASMTYGSACGAMLDPTAHECEVRGFEAADARSLPPRGAAVFFGSSTIRLWSTLASDMAPTPTVQRGFGGSTMEQALHNFDRLVVPCAPRLLAVYEGDNDVARGVPPSRIVCEFQQLVARAFAAEVQSVLFISIKPSPSRARVWPQAQAVNAAVRALAANDSRVEYVDVATPFLNDEGLAREELFETDMLHLNARGYAIWTAVLQPHVHVRMIPHARDENTSSTL